MLIFADESTFADAVESLSRSAIQTGSSSALNTTSPDRTTAAGSTSQQRISSATSAVTVPTRRTDTRRLPGHILSTLIRWSGRDAAEPAFPAETQRATMSGTTQDTTTTPPFTTVAHMSTSLSSGEPQTSESMHT